MTNNQSINKTEEMKREILFRGKRNNGSWVEGMLTKDKLGHYRIQFDTKHFTDVVLPETVGQFTGLLDKKGTKIFEGDIVKHSRKIENEIIETIHEVYFDNELLEFGLKQSNELFNCQFNKEFQVIGNIHDNKELLNFKI